MIDRFLEAYLKADATLVALMPSSGVMIALGLFEQDGTTPDKSIYRARVPQNHPRPFILITTPHGYDGGNTTHGVSGDKYEPISLCVCGNNSTDEIDAIRDRLEVLIIPLRKVWLPSNSILPRIYAHYVMWTDARCFTAPSPDGGEENFPQWEIPLRTCYNLPVVSS